MRLTSQVQSNVELTRLQRITLTGIALLFVTSGVMHFRATDTFARIVPPYVPHPRGAVYLSGLAEIMGGAGLFKRTLRRWAAGGLTLLLVAVFPANLYMATASVQVTNPPLPQWMLYARLPLQAVLIYLVLWSAKARGFSPSAQTVSK